MSELSTQNNSNTAVSFQEPNMNSLSMSRSDEILTNADTFSQIQRVATLMGNSTLTPKHLKVQGNLDGTVANCFRVCVQAMQWGLNPFCVMDECYLVHGKLGYQGKLVAAIINTRAGIEGRLKYTYKGDGKERACQVSGVFIGDSEPSTVVVELKKVRTSNEMWDKDPDQKLAYTGAVKWARKHAPEVIMGVQTDDDLDYINEKNKQVNSAKALDVSSEIFGDEKPKDKPTETPEPPKEEPKKPSKPAPDSFGTLQTKIKKRTARGSLIDMQAAVNESALAGVISNNEALGLMQMIEDKLSPSGIPLEDSIDGIDIPDGDGIES